MKYWPGEVGEASLFGSFQLELSEDEKDKGDYVTRKFKLSQVDAVSTCRYPITGIWYGVVTRISHHMNITCIYITKQCICAHIEYIIISVSRIWQTIKLLCNNRYHVNRCKRRGPCQG